MFSRCAHDALIVLPMVLPWCFSDALMARLRSDEILMKFSWGRASKVKPRETVVMKDRGSGGKEGKWGGRKGIK